LEEEVEGARKKHYNHFTSKQRSQQPVYKKEDNSKKIPIATTEDKDIIDNSDVDEKNYSTTVHDYKFNQQRSHR